MRLSKIKLSGFKSFVDPTLLELPGNLTGVVGPNGCGKSNIVDAVNWVLGESSAKHLRGDSIADVVFNGANTRKPVGQASVEIVFDNADGSAGGQYAGYSEIAIRRQMGRDGISSYFLNGTRCRRRDITDIFLGTGVGARGYSVIEQGMISRVIEAKPDELRTFLEEAAGISKYKERRRDTENRIRHTKENLARLADIREELGRQLAHLERQSQAAERYKKYKAEERELTARLLGVRLRDARALADAQQADLGRGETAVEEALAAVRAAESELARLREAQGEASEQLNAVQGEFYGMGAEVSRLEQQIKHGEERREQLRQDLQQAEQNAEQARAHLSSDESSAREIGERLVAAEPERAEAETAERSAHEQLEALEQAMQAWQAEWDSFNAEAAAADNEARLAESRIEHLEQEMASAERRAAALRDQLEGLLPEAEAEAIERLEAELAEATAAQQRLLEQEQRRRERAETLRGRLEALEARIGAAREQRAELDTRLASLEALQRAALGPDPEAVQAWLEARGLEAAPRLARRVRVAPGWERALEAAMRLPLTALCLEPGALDADWSDRPGGALAIIAAERDDCGGDWPASAGTPLSAYVQGDTPVPDLLCGVYAAETVAEGRAMSGALGAGELVACRDGSLLGPGWVRFPPGEEAAGSVLEREAELEDLRRQAEALAASQREMAAEREALRAEQEALAAAGADEREQERCRERITSLRSEIAGRQARLESMRERRVAIERELSELEDQREADAVSLDDRRGRLRESEAAGRRLEARRSSLAERREQLQGELQAARDAWRRARDRVHEVSLRVESMRSQTDALDRALERNRSMLSQTRNRVAELQRELEDAEAPLAGLRRQLEQALAQRLEVENRLGEARRRVQEVDAAMREAEQRRVAADEQLQGRREEVENLRVELRGLQVRVQDIEEQLGGHGFDPDTVLAGLEEALDEQACREAVEAVERRIHRLGPINLAAIDEFAELSERKTYLDNQHADLTEALTTLEEAIRRIDRETRTRFKETYDKVNSGLQRLFPTLFGGGHAYLELTGDDLLETGVTVMARPPGKRNSTIHLLSGGEKALTAIALIFAIFELNPAPFCLLDEVDAPLDDANVARYCELLRSMSSRVQFLFVTHNKITMEIAERLIGVTMQEPGVSRLVAVDMDEAVDMALSA